MGAVRLVVPSACCNLTYPSNSKQSPVQSRPGYASIVPSGEKRAPASTTTGMLLLRVPVPSTKEPVPISNRRPSSAAVAGAALASAGEQQDGDESADDD